MILSHDYRFIFIKTMKTAGTSIEIFLSRYLGPLDVITRITPRDEVIRARQGIGPRNFVGALASTPNADMNNMSDDECEEHIKNTFDDVEPGFKFYNHMPAEEIKSITGPRIWNSYYKFCVERNPYDRMISFFFWCRRNNPDMVFSEFIRSSQASSNYPLYSIDGQIAVDKVIDFENLNQELADVLGKLGISYEGWLPNAKSGFRTDNRTWEEFINEEDKAFIREKYKKEFETLGMD